MYSAKTSMMQMSKNKRPDIINGNITKTLIVLSAPIILSMLLHTAFNIIDAIFIGRLSSDALAAITLTFPIIFFIIAIGSGIRIGTTSLIARFIGAKKIDEARQVASHSIIIGIMITILSIILGLVSIDNIFIFMGADYNVIALATDYINIIFYGIVIMYMSFILNGILHGEGDMRTPMKALVIAVILNIILDPLLIFGIGPFPTLGIKGAAIATVIARISGLVYLMFHFISRKSTITPIIHGFKYDNKIIRKILSIGIPASLSTASMSISFIIITSFVARFGSEAIAAFGAAGRVESIAALPTLAIASVVITMVGQNAGNKRYDRSKKTIKSAIKLVALAMILLTSILITFPDIFIKVFSEDPTVISTGSEFLSIAPLGFLFMAIIMIIGAGFQGLGKGMPVLIITLTRLFVINIPLAYYLAFIKDWGLKGIWWSFVIATLVTAIMSVLWFRKDMKKLDKKEQIKENID